MKAFPDSHMCNNDGMDLRDYFAAKAMQGYVSKKLIDGFDEDVISEMSYKIADAMMEARKQ
jgi:hypothetical protein